MTNTKANAYNCNLLNTHENKKIILSLIYYYLKINRKHFWDYQILIIQCFN